jgi:hypothetical protein
MITNFQEQFVDRYQDTFHKVLVARKLANYRLEANLTQGDKVHRFAVDMSSVLVRTITALTDRTVDAITNSQENLEIDQYKGTTFPISHWEETLQKNPDLGLLYGMEAGILVAEHTDATVLNQVLQADKDFDAGDLTTLVSSGVPIDLDTLTNVPIMVTRAKAKLANANRVRGGNMVWVVDDYALSAISQHVIGRDTQMGDRFYQNGFSGTILGDDVLVSDNLTGEATLAMATNPTATNTVSVNGVVFTYVATLGAAGDLHIGTAVDDTRLNQATAWNAIDVAIVEAATTGYTPVSAANQAIWNALRITATNDNAADTLNIKAVGAGRLTVAETFTDATDKWQNISVHCYYGKKGAIDVVMASEVRMKLREEPKQDTVNVFNDVIYGVKTFADGKKKMLDVLVRAQANTA